MLRHQKRAADQTDHPDRLSSLPNALLITILSFLSTRIAAHTSLLSRHFRHLWQECPSLELVCENSYDKSHYFVAIAYYALRRRNHPLVSLRVDFQHCEYAMFIYVVLSKAYSLGVRHLIIESWPSSVIDLSRILHMIFSMHTLESLTLPIVFHFAYLFRITSTGLRSLSLELHAVDPIKFNQLISELCSLKDLRVNVRAMTKLIISSKTVSKLKLTIVAIHPRLDTVMLCLPALELLHLENDGPQKLPQFEGNITSLRKVVVNLDFLCEEDCGGVAGLLNYVSHVEELILHLTESEFEKDPFLILLEPGKEAPYFPNLKHLEVIMCFHKHNFEAIISMIGHSPALELVKLVHEVPVSNPFGAPKRREEVWASKLPRNADGNNHYARFTNLHLGESIEQFAKLLKKKLSP